MGTYPTTKNVLYSSLYQGEDDIFEIPSKPESGFFLNHQTNKSSVLCLESQNVTCQYLALQQLDAHHRMIARAKGSVDSTAPKSMQSYKSVADKKKKSLWQQQQSNYPRSSAIMKQSSNLDLLKIKTNNDDQFEEDESLNGSSVNKGVQTSVPFSAFSSKTADKISWYLEAIHEGELQSHFLMCSSPQSTSVHSANLASSAGNSSKKRIIRGDIMEWHKDQFAKPKSFSPRILANNNAKSKVKVMRCYNPPYRKKKTSSVNSTDTFESYEDEEECNEEDFEEEESDIEEIGDEASSEASHVRIHSNKDNPSFSSAKITAAQKPNSTSSSNHLFDLNRNKEDKYLSFLSKVTEDILRSGVYTDRAIQRAFEFHMQFHQSDEDRSKLQMLLEQVLEGLQISSDETDEILSRRSHFSNQDAMSISRPATPPEKENPADDFSGLSNLLRTKNLSLESNNDEETVTSHQDMERIETEISNQVRQLSVDDS